MIIPFNKSNKGYLNLYNELNERWYIQLSELFLQIKKLKFRRFN